MLLHLADARKCYSESLLAIDCISKQLSTETMHQLAQLQVVSYWITSVGLGADPSFLVVSLQVT